VPNFIKIGQTIAEMSQFNGFQNAAVRHLGFVKFAFLMVCAVKGHILHQLPNITKIGQTVTKISRFL